MAETIAHESLPRAERNAILIYERLVGIGYVVRNVEGKIMVVKNCCTAPTEVVLENDVEKELLNLLVEIPKSHWQIIMDRNQ